MEVGRMMNGTSYKVLGLIGQGGMGSVYEVQHVELGRNFVLKVLHEQFASRRDLVARMKNEWTALARLSHANIVQVTDAGRTSEGRPFYVMERLDGETLGALIKRRGPLPMHEASTIVMDVLAGLSAAHAIGAVHRDVKPQNIFVVRGGPTKLLDFGIAQVRDQVARVVTAAGVSIGTPRYMAPEQAEGKRVDARADIYSVGLVLYEMLAGKGPFAHLRDHNALVLAHIADEPARLDTLDCGVSQEMADLVHRWLSKNPDSRPRTASAALAEIAALRASLPAAERVDTTTSAGVYDALTLGADAAPLLREDETLDAPTSAFDCAEDEGAISLSPTVSMPPPSPRRPSARAQRPGLLLSGREEAVPLRDAARLVAAWGTVEATPPGFSTRVRQWEERWGPAARLSALVAVVSFAVALLASRWWSPNQETAGQPSVVFEEAQPSGERGQGPASQAPTRSGEPSVASAPDPLAPLDAASSEDSSLHRRPEHAEGSTALVAPRQDSPRVVTRPGIVSAAAAAPATRVRSARERSSASGSAVPIPPESQQPAAGPTQQLAHDAAPGPVPVQLDRAAQRRSGPVLPASGL